MKQEYFLKIHWFLKKIFFGTVNLYFLVKLILQFFFFFFFNQFSPNSPCSFQMTRLTILLLLSTVIFYASCDQIVPGAFQKIFPYATAATVKTVRELGIRIFRNREFISELIKLIISKHLKLINQSIFS